MQGISNTGTGAMRIFTKVVKRLLNNFNTGANATFAGDVALTGSGAKIISASSSNDNATLFLSGAGSGKDTRVVFGNNRNLLFERTSSSTPTSTGTTVLTLDINNDATFANKVRANNWFQGVDGTNTLYSSATAGTILQTAGLTANNNDSKIYFRNSATTVKHTFDTNNGDATFVGAVTSPTFLGDLNGTINTVTTAVTKANATNDTTVATTAFVQNLIGTIPAGLVFQGTWNAATNTPTLTSGSGTTGHFYIVSVDGTTNLDGITDWKVGDWAVFVEQGASDQWEKVDNSSVLDGVGTGQTLPLWAGSGTSNTLTDSNIKQDSSGNIGIGSGTITSPPQDIALTIQSTTNTSRLILKNSSTGVGSNDGFRIGAVGVNVEFEAKDSGDFQFYTGGGIAKFIIKNSGNVGIGTASPDSKLHVESANAAGANFILESTHSGGIPLLDLKGAASAQLRYKDELNVIQGRVDFGDSGTFNFIDVPNNSSTLYLKTGGNVGIGTTTPGRKFVVSSGEASGIEIEPNYTAGVNEILSYNRSTSVYETMRLNGGDFQFQIGGTERMRIDSSGNVGIGTTSSTAKLHIAKTTTWGEMSNPIINIQNNGTGGNINIPHNMGSITWKSGSVSTAEIKAVRNTPASGDNVELRFSTSSSGVQGERMTIDNIGNVGYWDYCSSNQNYKLLVVFKWLMTQQQQQRIKWVRKDIEKQVEQAM